MAPINENFGKLPGSYLFSTVAQKVAAYRAAHPEAKIIRLGIGDVTQPLAPAVIRALHGAVDEMGRAESFRGYAPDKGYDFLREAIAKADYAARGCDISADEIFVSDGAKSDSADIQELFGPDAVIAVSDPVYPVYVDSNALAGRCGTYDPAAGKWDRVIYMPCTAENGFAPDLPGDGADMIYLCSPNNPTGMAMTKDQLQRFVDYANCTGAVILFDAAYEAYIQDENIPHSIYECEGAKTCAIELRSFSKNAGFTGLRLGCAVVPKDLVRGGASLHAMWARRHGTKFNGAPYIVQRAGEAVYSAEGQAQMKEQIGVYRRNAKVILDGLTAAGYTVYGGVNSPYVWLRTPENMTSWAFFDWLLEEKNIGRPSTYAPIVTTLSDRKYVKKEKKSLVPTELGFTVNDIMVQYFTDIVDVQFTAAMEDKLDDVESKGSDWKEIISDFYDPFEKELKKAEDAIEKVRVADRPTGEICELCGRPMVIKSGRFGDFIACSGYPECKNTKPIVRSTGVKCPECGKDIVERRSRKGKIFYGCSGFPSCKVSFWYRPVEKTCPKCGSLLLERKGRGTSLVCSNEECDYKE